MNITTLEVAGILPAMKGMRNAKKSWGRNDTVKDGSFDNNWICIGNNDMKLAQTLIAAGEEHSKYMRQIQVWADFDMPLYWWSEFVSNIMPRI